MQNESDMSRKLLTYMAVLDTRVSRPSEDAAGLNSFIELITTQYFQWHGWIQLQPNANKSHDSRHFSVVHESAGHERLRPWRGVRQSFEAINPEKHVGALDPLEGPIGQIGLSLGLSRGIQGGLSGLFALSDHSVSGMGGPTGGDSGPRSKEERTEQKQQAKDVRRKLGFGRLRDAPLLAQVGVIAILGLIANCAIGVGVYLESRGKMGTCRPISLYLFLGGGLLYAVAFGVLLLR
jgi:hypothetical protein